MYIRTTYLTWRRECKVLAVSIQARIKARGAGDHRGSMTADDNAEDKILLV